MIFPFLVIGPIRRIYRGKRLLLWAWIDDNSPLKSRYPAASDKGVYIGKGYDKTTGGYPRFIVRGSLRYTWGAMRPNGGSEPFWNKPHVPVCVIGIGFWAEAEDL